MAGAGVRVFQPGEVLTASNVNSYLQDQVVARFANAAARDAAFGGVGQPTLEEGRVCYLDSTNALQFYSGTQWVSISAEAVTGAITTKGDIVVGTGLNSIVRVGVGSNTQILAADSSTPSGVAWVSAGTVVADGSITTAKIADEAVTSAKIADGAVSQTDLAVGAPRAGFRSARNVQAGNYTLALSDLGGLVEMNNGTSSVSVAIPANASVAFEIGDRVDILQTGTGVVTLSGSSGVTVNAFDGGLLLGGQYAAATVIKRDTNTWVAIGNLST